MGNARGREPVSLVARFSSLAIEIVHTREPVNYLR